MRCDVPLRLSHRANLLIIIGKTMIPHLFLLIPYIYCDKHKNHTLRSPNTTDFNIINCRSFSYPKYDYELPFPFFFSLFSSSFLIFRGSYFISLFTQKFADVKPNSNVSDLRLKRPFLSTQSHKIGTRLMQNLNWFFLRIQIRSMFSTFTVTTNERFGLSYCIC